MTPLCPCWVRRYVALCRTRDVLNHISTAHDLACRVNPFKAPTCEMESFPVQTLAKLAAHTNIHRHSTVF